MTIKQIRKELKGVIDSLHPMNKDGLGFIAKEIRTLEMIHKELKGKENVQTQI